MQIKQQYVVDGELFDTMEEAEQYVADNADKVRVDAFIEHLRNQGAQRITRTTMETVEEFIKFENGYYVNQEPTNPATEPEPEQEVPEPVESGEEEDNVVPLNTAAEESETTDSTSLFAQDQEAEDEPPFEPDTTEDAAPAEQAEAKAPNKSLFGT